MSCAEELHRLSDAVINDSRTMEVILATAYAWRDRGVIVCVLSQEEIMIEMVRVEDDSDQRWETLNIIFRIDDCKFQRRVQCTADMAWRAHKHMEITLDTVTAEGNVAARHYLRMPGQRARFFGD
jgi:hypothetical protein